MASPQQELERQSEYLSKIAYEQPELLAKIVYELEKQTKYNKTIARRIDFIAIFILIALLASACNLFVSWPGI